MEPIIIKIDLESVVLKVIAEKEEKGQAPIQCDLHDIVRTIEGELIDGMRKLVISGEYEGAITINKIPIVRRKD